MREGVRAVSVGIAVLNRVNLVLKSICTHVFIWNVVAEQLIQDALMAFACFAKDAVVVVFPGILAICLFPKSSKPTMS